MEETFVSNLWPTWGRSYQVINKIRARLDDEVSSGREDMFLYNTSKNNNKNVIVLFDK